MPIDGPVETQLWLGSCAMFSLPWSFPVTLSLHWTSVLPLERMWSLSPYRVQKVMGQAESVCCLASPGLCQKQAGVSDCLQELKNHDHVNLRFSGTFGSFYNLLTEEGWTFLCLDAHVPA